MRLLIIDDNDALAEITAELLSWADQRAHYFQTITLAGDLESSLRLLPQHDAVLCDGEFPISPDSRFINEEWDVVFREACRFGIHFVLYSGSVKCLDDARDSDVPAIAKPATIEKIYALLTQPCAPNGQPTSLTSGLIAKQLNVEANNETGAARLLP